MKIKMSENRNELQKKDKIYLFFAVRCNFHVVWFGNLLFDKN